jgi:hypothetical protein
MGKWQIYAEEARTQIRFAERSYLEFERCRDAGDCEGVFYHLHHFIAHVAAIERILNPKPNSPRASVLADKVNLDGIDIAPACRMRNHLEHFDERLDRWVAEHQGYAFFDMNITTGSVGFPYEIALRALDGDTLRFLGEEYNLPELHAGILQIDRHLASLEKQ